jgi:hypothetical protein
MTSRSRHADRNVRAIAEQQLGAAGQTVERRLQRGVAIRVHPVAVQRDRQVLQELAELARERLLRGRRPLARRRGRRDGRAFRRQRRRGFRVHLSSCFRPKPSRPAPPVARRCTLRGASLRSSSTRSKSRPGVGKQGVRAVMDEMPDLVSGQREIYTIEK